MRASSDKKKRKKKVRARYSRFFGLRGIGLPMLGLGCHHSRRNARVGEFLQKVDPAVTDAVAELLFLPPEDVRGQIGVRWGVEGFAEDEFLDPRGGD